MGGSSTLDADTLALLAADLSREDSKSRWFQPGPLFVPLPLGEGRGEGVRNPTPAPESARRWRESARDGRNDRGTRGDSRCRGGGRSWPACPAESAAGLAGI